MKSLIVYKRKIPALKTVKEVLIKSGFEVKAICRDNLNRPVSFDLIVTLGGDGTVLATAPFAGNSPMIGVRAFPEKSIGFYCTSDVPDFKGIMIRVMSGKLLPKKLPLLELSINGKTVKRLALNEFLVTSANPAQTSRYVIKVAGRKEVQRSSGIWISSGPGSGAAIFNAGGKKLPITSDVFQFVVREPCPFTNESYKLLKGIIMSSKFVEIISMTNNLMIYSDGFAKGCLLPCDSQARITISKKHLNMFV